MRYLENKHYFCATNYIVIIRMNKHILSFYLFFLPFSFFSLWSKQLPAGIALSSIFDKSVYGKGTQTWQIAPYDDKWVYFANKNGMVQFDGNVWNVFPLNNASDVRSVLASATQKRIYVGGINEFGYYEPDADGSLAYHCMSDTLESSVRFLGNVWGIHETDNILYFQGDGCVVKFLNRKIYRH